MAGIQTHHDFALYFYSITKSRILEEETYFKIPENVEIAKELRKR